MNARPHHLHPQADHSFILAGFRLEPRLVPVNNLLRDLSRNASDKTLDEAIQVSVAKHSRHPLRAVPNLRRVIVYLVQYEGNRVCYLRLGPHHRHNLLCLHNLHYGHELLDDNNPERQTMRGKTQAEPAEAIRHPAQRDLTGDVQADQADCD